MIKATIGDENSGLIGCSISASGNSRDQFEEEAAGIIHGLIISHASHFKLKPDESFRILMKLAVDISKRIAKVEEIEHEK